tara:strand:- start:1726 stop:2274 length:549 start_codon:yes stop_codon:yes gene_type:complete
MSSFEFNKFLASLIIAIIVVVIIGKFGDILINSNKNTDKETAYKIEIPETTDNSSKNIVNNQESIESISAFLASASLENGKKIYKKCGTCHNYEKDSKSKIGPNLWNIINRPKANVEGFAYSNALVEFGGNWSYEELNNFLYKPKQYIPRTKMNFNGLNKQQDRADLILWLRENSDDLVDLP